MKKILIALDYDSSAQSIAENGVALAHAMNAQAILLHVISDASHYASVNYSPVMGFDMFNSLDLMQSDSTENLKNAAQQYLLNTIRHLGDQGIMAIVKEGDYGDMILATAKELQVDIIVMGTHSRHGLDKFLMGSVAEKVLHKSTIPLYIIPIVNAS
ncbi:MAG: universal stress protein [Bacteroidetes bacterium]|nr:universal stress protein [Bacteroidota bacterium]